MTLNIKTKKKSIISIALLLVFVTALISSGCQNDSKNIGNFAFTKENYPKMGGSLANQPLSLIHISPAINRVSNQPFWNIFLSLICSLKLVLFFTIEHQANS